jgi:hypothetical protein
MNQATGTASALKIPGTPEEGSITVTAETTVGTNSTPVSVSTTIYYGPDPDPEDPDDPDGPDDPDDPDDAHTVSLDADTVVLSTNDAPVTITATLENDAPTPVSWSVSPSGLSYTINGDEFTITPANSTPGIYTVTAKDGDDCASDSATVIILKLEHETESEYPVGQQDRTNLGVAEYVNLNIVPGIISADWSSTSGSLTNHIQGRNSVKFEAPHKAGSATVTAKLDDVPVSLFVEFNVIEPTGKKAGRTPENNILSVGEVGISALIEQIILPLSVSFYRLEFRERDGSTTNRTGYFANTNLFPEAKLFHESGEEWVGIRYHNNNAVDLVELYGDDMLPKPWYDGSFTWEIPNEWRVVGSSETNSFGIYTQAFYIDTNGTVSITKFGATVSRDTNGVYTATK